MLKKGISFLITIAIFSTTFVAFAEDIDTEILDNIPLGENGTNIVAGNLPETVTINDTQYPARYIDASPSGVISETGEVNRQNDIYQYVTFKGAYINGEQVASENQRNILITPKNAETVYSNGGTRLTSSNTDLNVKPGNNWSTYEIIVDTDKYDFKKDGVSFNTLVTASDQTAATIDFSKFSFGDKITVGLANSGSYKRTVYMDDIIVQTISKETIAQNAANSLVVPATLTSNLPTSVAGGFGKTVSISWESTTNVVDAGGTVNYPAEETTDTITATFTVDGEYKATKDFEVTVPSDFDLFFPNADKTNFITGNLLKTTASGKTVTYSVAPEYARYIAADGTVTLPMDYIDVMITATAGELSDTYKMTLTPKGAATHISEGFETSSGVYSSSPADNTFVSDWTVASDFDTTNGSLSIKNDDTRTYGNYLYMDREKGKGPSKAITKALENKPASAINSGDYITYMSFRYNSGQYHGIMFPSSPVLYAIGGDSGNAKTVGVTPIKGGTKFIPTTSFDATSFNKFEIIVDEDEYTVIRDGVEQTSFKDSSTPSATDIEKLSFTDDLSILLNGSGSYTPQAKLDDIIIQTVSKQQMADNAAEYLKGIGTVAENLPTTLEALSRDIQVVWTSSNTDVIANDGTVNFADTAKTVTLSAVCTIDGKTASTGDFEVTVAAKSLGNLTELMLVQQAIRLSR